MIYAASIKAAFRPDKNGHGYDMGQFLPYAERPNMSQIRTLKPVLETVPLSRFKASQDYVHPNFMEVDDHVPVEAFKDKFGTYHILDGNHRAAKAVVKGCTHLQARVYAQHPDGPFYESKETTIRDILNESLAHSNDSLYHATSFQNAALILRDNTLKGNTRHINMAPINTIKNQWVNVSKYIGNRGIGRFEKTHGIANDGNTATRIPGTSLTRSKDFAKEWRNAVIFELSKHSLRQNHSVKPVSYWTDAYDQEGHKMRRKEHEEFVIGDVPNVERHIKAIHINKKTADRLYFSEGSFMEHLMTHPKIKFYEGT